jgi:hypothetical protein
LVRPLFSQSRPKVSAISDLLGAVKKVYMYLHAYGTLSVFKIDFLIRTL